MIVKNEERFLRGCLESVKDLVDEIVIVDTGSTDSTKEIAAEFGAKVSDFTWCDDFSAARNESLNHTTGDWILYLDADERIHEEYHKAVRRLISSGKGDAFLLNLRSKVGLDENSQYHVASYPRLFRKLKGLRFTGKVHEQITNSLSQLKARILPTDLIIEHLGYAQDSATILDKARRNQKLLLEQIDRRENYGYALYQLGQTEIILGETDKGLGHLREALAAGGYGKSVEASIHGIIAENMFKKGDAEAALAACEKSLAIAPSQAFAHLMMGEIYQKLDRHGDSLSAFLKAAREYERGIGKGKAGTAIEPVFSADIIYAKAGRAAMLAGDYETASSYIDKALRKKKTSQRAAWLMESLLRKKDYRKVLDAADEFREFENEDWYLRLVSSALIDTQNYADAARLLEKVSEPDEVSLSSLANCRMKIGDLAGCESAFRAAVEKGYKDTAGLELYGLVQFKLLNFKESAVTLSRALELDPANERLQKFLNAARAQLVAQGPTK